MAILTKEDLNKLSAILPKYTYTEQLQNEAKQQENLWKMHIYDDSNPKPITLGNDTSNTNTTNNNLAKGLNNYRGSILSSVDIGGKRVTNLGYHTPGTDPNKLKEDYGFGEGTKIVVGPNGETYAISDRSWLDQHGNELFNGINAVLGLGQLGLGLANTITARNFYKKQEDVMDEQLRESKNEYNRIQQLRKKLSSSYMGSK
jgi:hypothetical protein